MDSIDKILKKFSAPVLLDALAKKCGAVKCIIEVWNRKCYVDFEYGPDYSLPRIWHATCLSCKLDNGEFCSFAVDAPKSIVKSIEADSKLRRRGHVYSIQLKAHEEALLKDWCLRKMLNAVKHLDLYVRNDDNSTYDMLIEARAPIEKIIVELELAGFLQ